jgi:hypothetical protein
MIAGHGYSGIESYNEEKVIPVLKEMSDQHDQECQS